MTTSAESLRCPSCLSGQLRAATAVAIVCATCETSFPVVNGIPRFVHDENYARSFGLQWNRHPVTQLDGWHVTHLNRTRFFEVTQWSDDLRGERILEAGSGAGRFTAVAATTGAQVYSFDFSRAIDANHENNGHLENVHLFQADIYRMPFRPASFEKVCCLGVLQHCPDPALAFRCLAEQVAPGGELVVDVYSLGPRSLFKPKYWLRPVTTRMPPEQLYRIVRRVVPMLLPVKKWLVERAPFGRYAANFVPIAYQTAWENAHEQVSPERLVEMSLLDTFDWYSPAYDKPQTQSRVTKWFESAGFVDIHVGHGPNGIVGRGRRPVAAD